MYIVVTTVGDGGSGACDSWGPSCGSGAVPGVNSTE